MDKPIKHEHTEQIVCPWCGVEYGNAEGIKENHGKYNCEVCRKPFLAVEHVQVTYTTKKVEPIKK